MNIFIQDTLGKSSQWRGILFALLLCLVQQTLAQVKILETERPIAMFVVNPDSSFLCVTEGISDVNGHMEGDARFHIIDLTTRQKTYSSEEFSPKKEKFRAVKYGVLMSRRNKQEFDIQFLNKNNGQTEWAFSKLAGFLFNIESDFGILIEYRFSFEIVGICLSEGKPLWRKKVNSNFVERLNQVESLDSTSLIIVADKLYKINKSTGQEEVCKYDFSPQGANVSLLKEDNKCYVSDKKNLFCLDKDTFQKLWSVSHSPVGLNSLTSYKGKLNLLNLGYVKTDAIISPVNHLYTPFLATYDKNTGKQESIDIIQWDKSRGLITDVCNDTIFYVYNSQRNAFDQVRIDRSQMMIVTDNGCVYVLDRHFNLIKDYKPQEVYFKEFSTKDTTCISQKRKDGKDFYSILPNGSTIKHWPKGISCFCHIAENSYYSIGNTLYLVTDE